MAVGTPDFGAYPQRFSADGKPYSQNVMFVNAMDAGRNVSTSASVNATSWGGYYQALAGAGALSEFTFYGSLFGVVYSASSSYGKAAVYIDDVLVDTVDTYSANDGANTVYIVSSSMSPGKHVSSFRWTGEKNASSSGTTLVLVGFLVDSTSMPLNISPNNTLESNFFGQPIVYGYDSDASAARMIAVDASGKLRVA